MTTGDDKNDAEAYRLAQAEKLLRSVERVSPDEETAMPKPNLPKPPIQEEDYLSSIGTIRLTSAMPISFLLDAHASSNETRAAEEVVRKLVGRTAKVDGKTLEGKFLERLTGLDLEGMSARILQMTGHSAASGSAAEKLNQTIDELSQKYTKDAAAAIVVAKSVLPDNITQINRRDFAPLPLPQTKPKGQIAVEKVVELYNERKNRVSEDRIVSMVAMSAPGGGGFHISNIRYDGEYVILTGITTKAAEIPDEIIQHHSQVNILITDVPGGATMGFVLT